MTSRKSCSTDESGHRIHHVHDHRQFRLESFMYRMSMGFEAVHLISDGARFRQECMTFFGKSRITATPIEQLDTQLPFQIRQSMAAPTDCARRSLRAAAENLPSSAAAIKVRS